MTSRTICRVGGAEALGGVFDHRQAVAGGEGVDGWRAAAAVAVMRATRSRISGGKAARSYSGSPVVCGAAIMWSGISTCTRVSSCNSRPPARGICFYSFFDGQRDSHRLCRWMTGQLITAPTPIAMNSRWAPVSTQRLLGLGRHDPELGCLGNRSHVAILSPHLDDAVMGHGLERA